MPGAFCPQLACLGVLVLAVWLVLGLYIGIGLHINYGGNKSE